MPQMANITIKKSNGTTDIVYVAAAPSSGDKTGAVWRANAESTIFSHRPTFRATTRDNAARTARILDVKLTVPYVVAENGVLTMKSNPVASASVVIPTNVDAVAGKELFYQFGNLMVAALVRAMADEGYAAS